MRGFIVYIITFFFCSSAVSQSMRERINLDRGWRFHFGHAGDPSKDFNFSIAPIFSKTGKAEKTAIDKKFNDSTWRKLDLPHDWAVELPFVKSENFDVMAHGYKPVGGLFPETSIGWYRKKFNIAPSDSGKTLTLHFDGVFRNSQVWLNGFYLGRHESGYTGFTYDIADYVDYRRENVLVVRVDATQYEGWFYEGAGIYRHVWLNKLNRVHLDDKLFIHTKKSGSDAVVYTEIPVVNQHPHPVEVSVGYTLRDRNGEQVSSPREQRVRVAANQAVVVKDSVVLSNPRLWSVEDPYLYKAAFTVKSNTASWDHSLVRFGVREIEISAAKGLLVNGVPVKVYGVNCHQDHAGVGSAVPDFLQYYRIRLLKEMGVNAYRTSHNPATPELMDACDSLGMLVMAETRLLNSGEEYTRQLKDLIYRDRNHPSVFMWSIGNEEGYVQTQSVGKRLALSQLQVQEQLDPTRTSTYAADLGNVFNGINEVIPVRGFNYREKFVVPYHHDHPGQPVVGTEMGSTVSTRGMYVVDSVRGYLPDQDISAPWWASTAEAWWPTAATNDWYMGGFIWTGLDYRGEPTPFKWPNISSHFGVMDVCGFPKNLYYYYQSWWAKKDVIHITPHWNWKGREGEPIDVWVNSNADEVELFLNGKSLGKQKMPRNSHLKWKVKYQPGKLEARGSRNGKRITTTVETTDVAYKIVLTPDRSIVLADGKDGTVINVSVVDKRGREVPDAGNLIAFDLAGNGKIIGVGNGDPSCHEPDIVLGDEKWKRSLFNGKCQVIVQAGTTPGLLELNAKSTGLQGGQVIITTK